MRIVNSRDAIIALTPRNPFGRFLDGRPHVPDDLIERMARITSEQAWAILDREGIAFSSRVDGCGRIPIGSSSGRAVTAQMLPFRPDLQEVVQAAGEADGPGRRANSWVIDTLESVT